MRTSPSRRLAALLAMGALVLAACTTGSQTTAPTLPSLSGSSDDPGAAVTTTTDAVDPEEAFREFAACMREHGVDMPDPADGGEGVVVAIDPDDVDFEAIQEAEEECSPILVDAFGEFEMSPEQEAEIRDKELAFARCMRDNGIDWPDPGPAGQPSGDSGTIAFPGDEESMSVIESCTDEAFGSGSGLMEVAP